MRRLALVPLAISMLLFAPGASALGLGEIEMQSALNQRLDAEIPLRGVPEGESSRIIVTLASEEAFRQVGLQRPFSLTRLSFAIKQRDDGAHYVHVTSREPIVEPFLSFLVEVDWPSGNLLREYTVLLDPPVFVSDAPAEEPAKEEPAAVEPEAEPAGEMAAAGEVDTAVETEPETETVATGTEAMPSDEEGVAVAEPSRTDGDFSDTPVFLQVEQEEERAEAEARAVTEAEVVSEPEPMPTVEAEPQPSGYDASGGEYGPVQRGEALWNIAGQLKNGDMTIQQMMLALLRYNPEAFVDNNINRLRQGYVLRIPDADAVLSLSAQEAIAQVREQNALWQEYRRALRGGTGQAEQQAAAGEGAREAVTGDDADLRIVGSEDGGGATADPDTTASAGDSGAQASEQLKLAQEQLEAARMEKAELESRVGELEQTVGKMERLIELREDQLAKLQEQLRKIEEGAEPAAVLDGEMEDGEAATDDEAVATAEDAASDDEAAEAEDEDGTAGVDGDVTTDGAETSADGADGADADAGDADEEAATEEATTEAAAEDDEEAVGAGSGESGASSQQQVDQGVTTIRTRPSEPGILDQIVGVISSIGATIGGIVGGLGLGGLIPEPFFLPVVGAVVVLVLLGLMLAVRRRRGGAEEEYEEDFDSGAESMIAAGGDDSSEDFSALFEEEGGDDPTLADDGSGLMDSTETNLSTFAGDEETGAADDDLATGSFDLGSLDDTDETMTVTADSGDDDTIAEADVYLAYGLHQQAEDLLKLAIEEQPDRTDYRAKLLEAIYGGGRADDFVQQATAMQGHVADTDTDRNWLRVVAMGQELAPNEPLFQQDVDDSLKPAGGGSAQPVETDLDLGDGDDDTDLDFSFEDDAGDTGDGSEDSDDTFARTMMSDSDALASDERESSADSDELDASTDDDMDFDLGDLDLGDDETEAASASGSATGASDETADDDAFDLGDLDLDESDHGDTDSPRDSGDDDDQLADFDLGDLEVSEDVEDSAERTGGADDEGDKTQHQIELDDDDGLDFDIGGEDDGGSSTEDDDGETTVAGGLDTADIDLGEFDIEGGGFDESDTVSDDDTDLELDRTDDDTDLDFDFDRKDGDAGLESGDGEDDDEVLDLGGDDEFDDVNLEDLTADLTDDDGGLTGPGSDDTAVGDDQGADDTAVEQTATEDTAVEDIDLDLGGLADTTDDEGEGGEDEYGTMLDLARAYIDMGDSESARSALEEVAESGNDQQRSEAKSLLETI